MKHAQRVLGLLAIAAVYYLGSRLGFTLGHLQRSPVLLWIPTAFGLSMVLLYGLRWVPGCALGAAVIALTQGVPLAAAVFTGLVEALEVSIAFILLRRLVRFRVAFDRSRDVIAFIGVTFVLTLFGTSTLFMYLVATDVVHPQRSFDLWGAWWWARWSGVLIVAPAIMTSMRRTQHSLVTIRHRLLEFFAMSLLGGLTVLLIVAPWTIEHIPDEHTGYYVLPVLVWAGLRFGPRGAALASFGACVTGIVAQSIGLGHFARMFELQTFVALSSTSTLLLSAVAVERLRAVERQAAVVVAAIDGIISVDERGCILEINPAAERMLGVHARQVIGKDVASVAMPERFRGLFHRALRRYHSSSNGILSGERYRSTAWRQVDDTEFPVEISITRLPLEDKVIFTGFVRDISAEQRAERAVREAQEDLERKVDQRTRELKLANANLERRDALMRQAEQLSHLGSFDYDIERRSLKWSDELYRIYGKDPATFVPTLDRFLDAIHPDERAAVKQRIMKTIETGEPMDRVERIVRPDGMMRTIQTLARVYTLDGSSHIVGCCQDITERAQAEEVRARLSGLVEYSDDAIIGLSPDGVIETWNAAAERIFGYAASEVIGKNCDMLVRPDDCGRLHAVYEALRNRHHVAHYELLHKRRDGSTFDASVTTSAVVGPEGEVVGLCKVLRDITEQKRAENEMRASLREKEVLLREIHHRVKNNLQVIASLLNLQLTNEPVDTPAYKALLESQSRIHSMSLVHQLLYRSKDLAQIDVGEYLSRLVYTVAQTYGASRKVAVDVHAASVLLDIDRAIPCGLIVAELLMNSLTHGFPNGTQGHVRVALEQDGGEFVLTVIDDGVGIPPELATESPQTFGLQIVRTLAAQLEGTVTIVRNAGTRATLRFPTQSSSANT